MKNSYFVSRTRNDFHSSVVWSLLAGILLLCIIHIVLQYRLFVLGEGTQLEIGGLYVDLTFWFDLDSESTVCPAFNAGLLAFAGILMLYASAITIKKPVTSLGWILFACVLLYMAIDEFRRLHEVYPKLLGMENGFGTSVIPQWVLVMGIVVLFVVLSLGYFWWKLPPIIRVRLAVAAVVFLCGAVGVEILTSIFVMDHGRDNFTYALLNVPEEGLEMFGVLIVIDTVLMYITSPGFRTEAKATLASDGGYIASRRL